MNLLCEQLVLSPATITVYLECVSHVTAHLWVMFPYYQVDFQDAEARTVAERRRIEERQRRMETIYKERVEAASRDMDGKYYIVQHHSC